RSVEEGKRGRQVVPSERHLTTPFQAARPETCCPGIARAVVIRYNGLFSRSSAQGGSATGGARRAGRPHALVTATAVGAALLAPLVGAGPLTGGPLTGAPPGTQAQARVLYVGITMALTGADAEEAMLETDGALMAIEEANARGGVAGFLIEPIILNNATP